MVGGVGLGNGANSTISEEFGLEKITNLGTPFSKYNDLNCCFPECSTTESEL